MNWQQRVKHEAGCEHWAWGGESCTCQRDDTVAAIEAVVEAAQSQLDDLYQQDEAFYWAKKLQTALDRLNALGESEKGPTCKHSLHVPEADFGNIREAIREVLPVLQAGAAQIICPQPNPFGKAVDVLAKFASSQPPVYDSTTVNNSAVSNSSQPEQPTEAERRVCECGNTTFIGAPNQEPCQ